MKKKLLSLILCLSLSLGVIFPLVSCNKDGDGPGPNGSGGKTNPDALVLMSDELDGLFNPFFSTTAADGTIVSMTQISMLGMNYVNGKVELAYGNNEPVVTLDYEQKANSIKKTTTYTFVIKNGIKFSDGHALTIEDVLFNLYVYLDPVYTGSSTMYSTDILGLADYRAQKHLDSDSSEDETIDEKASAMASNRLNELINLFIQHPDNNGSQNYDVDYDKMVAAILAHKLSSGYKDAVNSDPSKVTNQDLLNDYENALKLYKEELYRDYKAAQSAFSPDQEPYKTWWDDYFSDPIFAFMCYEGISTIKYKKDDNGKDIKTEIEEIIPGYDRNYITTMEAAIEYVYDTNICSNLHMVLMASASAAEIFTSYTATAKSILLEAEKNEDGSLKIPTISGIVSLGHNTDMTSITVNGTEYAIAQEHKPDGSPANENEYDVLQITINKEDPKAHWNFSFSVAPQHYYGDSAKYPVDIENNKFGVSWADNEFMSAVVQSTRNNGVPMGAGAYMATDASNGSSPAPNEFYKNNVVYFKANPNFFFATPKIEKVRYQVVSATNAISALKNGNVHFISPQYTDYNIKQLEAMTASGFNRTNTEQLGYGYIGVSADKVPNINLRKAIMCAMNTALSLEYYTSGTAQTIYYPMSTVSWAYPKDPNGNPNNDNGFDYPVKDFDDEYAISLIKDYMRAAGVSEGAPELKLTFTIAGSSAADHPTYKTFLHAEELLEECGWDITVTADANALKKLSTGALAVWAAAWGSTVDPDMYQVYHKDSAATSTKAWGYDAIKENQSSEDYKILLALSELIDDARETVDQDERIDLYKKALEKVLELAVELPVYQRQVLYAYNANVIKASSLPADKDINPYSSPLDRIWEIEFAN